MIFSPTLVLLVACWASPPSSFVESFVVPTKHYHSRIVSQVVLKSQEERTSSVATASGSTKTKQLGLLTFDLDDTLYPIAPVVRDANSTWMFSKEKTMCSKSIKRVVSFFLLFSDPIDRVVFFHSMCRRFCDGHGTLWIQGCRRL
jgi:hypothetical protein